MPLVVDRMGGQQPMVHLNSRSKGNALMDLSRRGRPPGVVDKKESERLQCDDPDHFEGILGG